MMNNDKKDRIITDMRVQPGAREAAAMIIVAIFAIAFVAFGIQVHF